MSDTPRISAIVDNIDPEFEPLGSLDNIITLASEGMKLERELAAVTAERDALLADNDLMWELFAECPAINFRRSLNIEQEVVGYNISGWNNDGIDFDIEVESIDDIFNAAIDAARGWDK